MQPRGAPPLRALDPHFRASYLRMQNAPSSAPPDFLRDRASAEPDTDACDARIAQSALPSPSSAPAASRRRPLAHVAPRSDAPHQPHSTVHVNIADLKRQSMTEL